MSRIRHLSSRSATAFNVPVPAMRGGDIWNLPTGPGKCGQLAEGRAAGCGPESTGTASPRQKNDGSHIEEESRPLPIPPRIPLSQYPLPNRPSLFVRKKHPVGHLHHRAPAATTNIIVQSRTHRHARRITIIGVIRGIRLPGTRRSIATVGHKNSFIRGRRAKPPRFGKKQGGLGH